MKVRKHKMLHSNAMHTYTHGIANYVVHQIEKLQDFKAL